MLLEVILVDLGPRVPSHAEASATPATPQPQTDPNISHIEKRCRCREPRGYRYVKALSLFFFQCQLYLSAGTYFLFDTPTGVVGASSMENTMDWSCTPDFASAQRVPSGRQMQTHSAPSVGDKDGISHRPQHPRSPGSGCCVSSPVRAQGCNFFGGPSANPSCPPMPPCFSPLPQRSFASLVL